ncbi:hypothetical protein GHT06_021282 [Daphnia sinensis]|nr:hypothetical protein GHT06_021282 [Daphnia sinensis]
MDLKVIPVLLLLLGLSMELEDEKPDVSDPNKQLPNKSHLDIFAEILAHKYADDGHLKLQEFTSLWSNLLGENNNTSTSPSLDSVCKKTLGQSAVCQLVHECMEPKEIFALASKSYLDKADLNNICPLMVYQLESGLCHNKKDAKMNQKPEIKAPENNKKPTPQEVWGYGILFVTLISLCSLVGVSVLPLMGKAFYSKLLTVLIGLAVGSLSGSSVFHLIPQAFGLMDSDPDHHYLQTSVLLFSGVWLFFMIERFLKIIMDWKEKKNQLRRVISNPVSTLGLIAESPGQSNALSADVEKIYESQEQVIKASFGHQAKPQRRHSHERIIHYKTGDSPISSVAWMIIFGDGFHNFIDGLSLGAAFNESIPTGMSISLAVMCEELPHELGDFAVLLSAGMTMRQALIYNFLSACTCYLGLVCGIILGEFEASQYIFALAGGMFLYIALVDMMPEMNEVAEEASRESVPQALKVLTLQNIGILSGVGALYLLARFQDQIRFV